MITAQILSNTITNGVAYAIIITNIGEITETINPIGNNTSFYPDTIIIEPSASITLYAITKANQTILDFTGQENTVLLPVQLQTLATEEYDELLSLNMHLEPDVQFLPKGNNTEFLLKQKHHFDNGARKTWLLTRVTKTEIVDLLQPITGQTPVAIIDCKEYSGTITWSPNHSTFAAGEIYTATAELTAKHGYTFNGVLQNTFTANVATVTNPANSGNITAVFPVTHTLPSFFTFDNETKTIISYNEVTGGTNAFIPPYINDLPVEHIASSAFNNLTSVTLPRTLLTISNNAFVNCNLSEITIPSSVTTIGDNAFAGCSFTSISMGTNTNVSSSAFGTTAANFKARYDWNDKKPGTYIFDTPECPNQWIQTEAGIEQFFKFNIQTQTIENYDPIGGTDVVIPNTIHHTTVLHIGNNAFQNKQINTIKLPYTLLSIGDEAFQENNLATIILPGSLVSIGASAFASNSLTTLYFPKTVASIGNNAFESSIITDITIGNGVQIGNNFSLGSYGAQFKTKYDWNGKRAATYLYDTEYLPNLWDEQGAGTAQYFQFNNTTNTITDYDVVGGSDITIPKYLYGTMPKHIAPNAFKQKSLTSVILPDSLLTIGTSAFDSNSLTSILLHDNVTSVASAAFANNTLDSITIGYNVLIADGTSFGAYGADFKAAYDSEKLSGKYEWENDIWFRYTQEKYFTFSAGNISGYNVAGGLKLSIPATINDINVTTIKANAFSPSNNGLGLQSLHISEGITTIEASAFRKNPLLTTVVIPTTVTTIGNEAFYDIAVNNITIGTNVTIGNTNSFGVYGAKFKTRYDSFTSKTAGTYTYDTSNYAVPTWVHNELGSSSFYAFNSTTQTITNYDMDGGTDLVIPSQIRGTDVIVLGESAFREKTPKITSVVIPDTVTTINKWAFLGNSIANVIFGNSLTTILESAFHTSLLTSVELPGSLTDLGPYVFYNTPSLTSVQLPANVNINWGISVGDGVFGTATPKFQYRYDSCLEKAAGTYIYDTENYDAPTWIHTEFGDEQFFGFNSSTNTITGFDPSFGTSIDIPATIREISVLTIANDAFNTKGLVSVTLPEGLITIGTNAFLGNTITSITVPSTVTTMGPGVFHLSPITQVTIGTNVSGAFDLNTFGLYGQKFESRYKTYTARAAGTYIYDTENYDAPTWIHTELGNEQFFVFDNVSAITGFDTDCGTSVNVPSTIRNTSVLTIANDAFNTKGIVNVTLSEGLVTIGTNAFLGNNITNVTIPSTVTTMGTGVFHLSPITQVTIGTNVGGAFDLNTFGLYGQKFESRYKTYTARAAGTYTYNTPEYPNTWWWNEGNTSQFFAFDGVNKIIGYDTDYGTDIVIPSIIQSLSVTIIGDGAFQSKGLTSVVIPDSIISIGSDSFRYNALTSVTFTSGSNLTTLGSAAFGNNDTLTNIEFPNSLTTMIGGVFYGCPLTSIKIPAGVAGSFDANTFGTYGTTFITRYDSYTAKAAGTYIYDTTNYAAQTWIHTELGDEQFFAFNDSTQTITGFDATFGTNITIPTSIRETAVTTIGVDAIRNKGITSVTIPEGITTIGNTAFWENASLANTLTLPNSITSVGNGAFGLATITTIIIGNDVIIGDNNSFGVHGTSLKALYDVEKIAGQYIYANDTWTRYTPESHFTHDGINAVTGYIGSGGDVRVPPTLGGITITTIKANAFNNKNLTNLVLPETITTVQTSACYNNSTLTSLTLSPNLTTLGDSAFALNKIASIVTIPASVTSVGSNCFYNNMITGADLSNFSLTTIPTGMFGTNQLSSLTLGEGITRINNGAFWTNKPLTSVTLPNSLTYIDIHAFRNCGLTSLTLPPNITNIMSNAFQDNAIAGTLTLPAGMTTIGIWAFNNNLIDTVTIPDSITNIPENVFYGNPIVNITIGAGVTIATNSQTMGINGASFKTLYDSNGQLAGTYNYSGGAWTKAS